jgi:hypothetical protein
MFGANSRPLSAVTASEPGSEAAGASAWREGLLSEQDLERVVGGITRSTGEEIPQ